MTEGRRDPVEGMMLFLVAVGRQRELAIDAGVGTLVAVPDVGDLDNMHAIAERGPVLLDSGVFGFASEIARERGCSPNEIFSLAPDSLPGYGSLVDTYERVVDALRDAVWGYVELDIGDANGKTATRERLEGDGFYPIPVYHALTDPPEYFDELCREYDRVCIGNLARSPRPLRTKIVAACMARREELGTGTWLHALGWGMTGALLHYPVNSLDAVTWIKPGKYREWPIRSVTQQIAFIEDRFLTYRSSDAYWGTLTLSAEGHGFMRAGVEALLEERQEALIGS